MLTSIDHVVIGVPDLDAACAVLQRELGLEASGGGRHEQLGTYNRLVWLGDSYLELLGVFDPVLARSSWIGAPALRALDERGGGFVALALASSDLDADLAALRAHGSTLQGPLPGERIRPDGRTVRWRLALPPAIAGDRPLFLIQHDPLSAEWDDTARAERAGQVHPAGGPVRLARVELEVRDLQLGLRHLRYDAGLAFRPSLAGGGARDASVGPNVLRLRHLRGPGIASGSSQPSAAASALPRARIILRLIKPSQHGVASNEPRPREAVLAGVAVVLEGD